MSKALVEDYYAAFNAGDFRTMLSLLDEDVVHDVNQGQREVGRDAFARFLAHMERCYREELRELVVMGDPSGTRFAAEFVVHGTYVTTDPGLPEARGQRYTLPAGAFLEVRGGKIARVTTYYNVREWLAQVASAS